MNYKFLLALGLLAMLAGAVSWLGRTVFGQRNVLNYRGHVTDAFARPDAKAQQWNTALGKGLLLLGAVVAAVGAVGLIV